MGGTKIFFFFYTIEFIVDGTRVACNNGAIEREMCINYAQLYLSDG